jgi:hypothetical protein
MTMNIMMVNAHTLPETSNHDVTREEASPVLGD